MSTLLDQIIDEAEMLADLDLLPEHATQEQIAKAVGEALNEHISLNSTASRLAEATYNRARRRVIA
jgi:hypothetical protein